MYKLALAVFAYLVMTASSAIGGGMPSESEPQSLLLDRHGAPLPSATAELVADMEPQLYGLSEPVRTTIDADLEAVLRKEIRATGKKFSALRGAALLMDAKTGAILAAVSETMKGKPTYFVSEELEPGSVMKALTIAGALATQTITADQTFDVSKPVRVGGLIINDYHRYDGLMIAKHILQESSNIGAAQIGLRMGYDNYDQFLSNIGLDVIVPDDRGLSPDEIVATMSFGRGVYVRPARLLAAYATMTNGGYKVRPSFSPVDHRPAAQVLDEQTSKLMNAYLRNVVDNGTGFKAKHTTIPTSGKTGTADKSNGELIASFIAVFPSDDPRYVLYVAFDEPQGIEQTYGFATGGWVAAPTACRIIAASASHLGLEQSGTCPNL